MNKCKARLAVMAVATGLAAHAQSAILTENVSVTPTSSTSLSFDFAKFNTSLGTLNSVELILTPNVEMGYDVYNTSAPQSVAFAEVSNPSASLVNTGLGLGGRWSSTQAFTSGSFVASSGMNYGPVLPFNFGITPSSTTVGPAGFTGAGNYDLILTGSALATSTGSPGGSLFYGFYADYSGALEVDFNYTAVPESTWMTKSAGFDALGMLGLASVRKKFLRLA